VRRHSYEAFAELLSALVLNDHARAEQDREKFVREAERYKNEQTEIEAEAHRLEQEVQVAAHKANRFNLGEVFLEIALVLTSVTLLTSERRYWLMGMGLGTLGVVVALTGFLIR
jgi:hypothetical protein